MKNKKIIIILCLTFFICIFSFFFINSTLKNKQNIISFLKNNLTSSDLNDSEKKEISHALDTLKTIENNSNLTNLVYFSDLQYTSDYNKEHLDSYFKIIKFLSHEQLAKYTINCGDLNNAQIDYNTSLKNLKFISNKFKNIDNTLLNVKGNHDCYIKHVPSEDISSEEYFDISLSHLKDKATFDSSNPKGGYYYIDLDDSNIRICVLNSFSAGNYDYIYDEQQIKFIANNMLNFSDKKNPKNWEVVFFTHTIVDTKFHEEIVTNADILLNLLQAYKNKNKFESDIVTVDYSNQKNGNLIAIITGHHHANYSLENSDILIIGHTPINVTYDRGSIKSYNYNDDNIVNFNIGIISIDTKNKMLYITNVGNGENRYWKY